MMSWQHPWKLQAKASLIIILIVGGAILVTELLHQYYVAELAKDVIHSKSLVLLRQIGARFQSEKQFHNGTLREKYLNDLMSRNPDLIFLPIFSEDPRYLERWGSVLARGGRRVTTMGTDCHRNSFPALLPDGERADSYRRMMIWFSNHLLVRPEAAGRWDDRHLKDALQSGRLYGAFEILGSPEGFDFYAEVGGEVAEMGSEVPFTAAPQLRIVAPTLRNPDPDKPAPTLTVRLLKAVEGGFEEVVSAPGSITYSPTGPGVYRAEVRMVPNHLADQLGQYRLADLGDFIWIYANPIYVR